MLGEAALTADDASRYFAAYVAAVHAIGARQRARRDPGPGSRSSSPHFTRDTGARSWTRAGRAGAAPRRARGAGEAHDVGLNIDAEESDRLDLTLDLLERLARDPALAGWDGIGFVVQAYQKRAPRSSTGSWRSRATAAGE